MAAFLIYREDGLFGEVLFRGNGSVFLIGWGFDWAVIAQAHLLNT